ncbi:hypothetical protein RRG08_036358 [Elysia crispata]|uniref:Uncharacterized protein n=1 Tax=Elysia crispata TaxID=231223 RepID=A0AAE0ZL40_9GAST|nr:hypothetical protein RRG08_036358 [Elysia crispata]
MEFNEVDSSRPSITCRTQCPSPNQRVIEPDIWNGKLIESTVLGSTRESHCFDSTPGHSPPQYTSWHPETGIDQTQTVQRNSNTEIGDPQREE